MHTECKNSNPTCQNYFTLELNRGTFQTLHEIWTFLLEILYLCFVLYSLMCFGWNL